MTTPATVRAQEWSFPADTEAASPTPATTTGSATYLSTALAAGATQTFVVNEERVYDQQYQLISASPDFLGVYLQNRTLSDAARRQLQGISDKKSQIAENERVIQDTQSQINELTQDETRIRQNINSLNNVSSQQQLVQGYARQLDQHEQKLATLRDSQADLTKKRNALQSELNTLINALNF